MRHKIVVNPWSLEGEYLSGRMSFDDVVEAIAAMGADGIDLNEMYMGFNPNPDPAFLRAAKRSCAAAGLEITSCWFWADLIAGFAMESFDATIAHVTRYLAVAEYLGARHLTIKNGNPPKGLGFAEGKAQLLRAYERLAPLAEDHGVIIGFEAPRAASPYDSPQGALALVKEFGSPYLTVTPDFESWRRPTERMPMRYAEDPDSVVSEPLPVQIFKDCLPYSPYIHAKFLEFDPTGTDPNFPLDEMFAAMRESGRAYDICVEYEGWIPDIHPDRDAYGETVKAIQLIRKALA